MVLRTLLALGAVVLVPALVRSDESRAPASAWVHPDAASKLVYQTLPTGDRIMDFSSAGYWGGGMKLPAVPVKKTVHASGDDDTAAIQAALDEVAQLPVVGGFRGAVLLEPGAFQCR